MTVPSERTRTVNKTRKLLIAILNTPLSNWDKKAICKEIASCLRHYPTSLDFAPDQFQDSFEFGEPGSIELVDKEIESYKELITKKKS